MRDINPPLTEQTAWQHLRVFIEDFVALWGKPIVLARWLSFPEREYKVCSAWLRALEAMLRRLLLIAAAQVTPPAEGEEKRRPPRKCAATGASFASDDSADWRVSFQLSTVRKATRSPRRRATPLPRRVWDPVPLALRFEALARAATNPERHIQRAARLLARHAQLPNRLFRQKLLHLSALRPYVAQCSLLLLEPFPEAWRPLSDTS